jgi:hypothetical protein
MPRPASAQKRQRSASKKPLRKVKEAIAVFPFGSP